MNAHPHLQHPPIIEALLNFEANAAEQWDAHGTLENAHKLFPEHTEPQTLRELNLEVAGAEPLLSHKVTAPIRGYLLRSPSQPTVHQVRRDGYAFSRLQPYEDWNAFVSAALAGWDIYQRFFKPEELHRLAVRFINRLEFPNHEFRQNRAAFLTTPPQVPQGLDWSFYNFAHQYSYAIPDSVYVVNVRLQRQLEPGVKEISAMTLDIEVTMRESLAGAGKSPNDVLEEMRLLKNQAFFHIVTDSAIINYR